MTDSEYTLLANAVTSLDAAILRQMKRRADTKNRLRELLDVADWRLSGTDISAQQKLRGVLKELRKTIETL